MWIDTAHTISQRLRVLKKIPPELLPLGSCLHIPLISLPSPPGPRASFSFSPSLAWGRQKITNLLMKNLTYGECRCCIGVSLPSIPSAIHPSIPSSIPPFTYSGLPTIVDFLTFLLILTRIPKMATVSQSAQQSTASATRSWAINPCACGGVMSTSKSFEKSYFGGFSMFRACMRERIWISTLCSEWDISGAGVGARVEKLIE